jgi:hypothetical protein
MTKSTDLFNIGAVCFGVVIGWITYRTLRRLEATSISDIASVIGAVGGAAVLGILKRGDSFAWYAIGLTAGFFGYLIVNLIFDPKTTIGWMGDKPGSTGSGGVVRD